MENLRVQKYVAALGISLMVIKFIAWTVSDSVSILTDSMESIVNVVAALIGLYALYLSSKPRDVHHPYGYGKVELISSLVEGVMITVAGAIIIFQAVSHIIDPEPLGSMDLGILLVAITAVANYAAGRYAIKKGMANRSMALVASGKHLCSDTYSSIGIILGLSVMMIFSHFGYDAFWLDAIIASIFGIIILITGIKVVKSSMDGVMDRIDEQVLEDVFRTIDSNRHENWIDIYHLRVTKYGPMIHIEFHVVLPRFMTVEDQSMEVAKLKGAIISEFGEYIDLTVMAEPCTADMCQHCSLDCESRSGAFVSMIEWNIDTVTDETEDHSELHFQS